MVFITSLLAVIVVRKVYRQEFDDAKQGMFEAYAWRSEHIWPERAVEWRSTVNCAETGDIADGIMNGLVVRDTAIRKCLCISRAVGYRAAYFRFSIQ